MEPNYPTLRFYKMEEYKNVKSNSRSNDKVVSAKCSYKNPLLNFRNDLSKISFLWGIVRYLRGHFNTYFLGCLNVTNINQNQILLV